MLWFVVLGCLPGVGGLLRCGGFGLRWRFWLDCGFRGTSDSWVCAVGFGWGVIWCFCCFGLVMVPLVVFTLAVG